jgi:two-component system nitrate/nitrite response regulator NarL
MSPASPHFLLVDDHSLFRTGLGMMLLQSWPQARVSQAADLSEARSVLQRVKPDLILLDVRLPDGHSLVDLPSLRSLAPDSPVLVMSAEVSGQQVLQARQAGVAGFLSKVASPSEVLVAVRAALAGQWAFEALPCEVVSPGDGVEPGLNDLQLSILRYLGRGTPNKAIARQLGMSESDVRAEVSWLTERLGATSREQAHAQALARGLLPP